MAVRVRDLLQLYLKACDRVLREVQRVHEKKEQATSKGRGYGPPDVVHGNQSTSFTTDELN